MKKIISFIILLSCVLITLDTTAQMSRKEKRQWKKRIKKLEPEQYKQLLDENRSLKGQVTSLRAELNGVDSRTTEKDEQIASYQSQITDLRNELSKAQKSRNVSRGSIDESKGVVFKVQIGAFTQKDLSKYLNNTKNFSGEEEGGVRKYTLGVFKDYWDADTFKKYLREMGVKDAWIVSYRDGRRVPIKNVLERGSKL